MTNDIQKTKSSVSGFYKKHPIISHLIIMVFVAFLVGWCMLFFLDVWTHHGDTAKMPNVQNIDSRLAVQTLNADGFAAEIADSVYDPRFKPGQVISMWPRPGAIVKPGREVYLTIASYQPREVAITMPLVNVSSRQALNYLDALQIRNVQIEHVPSQYPDLVVSARYKGRNIEPGMKLPVTAKVVLQIGVVPVVTDVDADAPSDDTDHYAGAVDEPSASAAYD